jgi:heme exporter protein C
MANALTYLANPARFLSFARIAVPVFACIATLLFAVGLWLAWFGSPVERYQGETVRIMYIHVPAAWMAMSIYVMIAISSIGSLIWRHPLADVAAKVAAPLGAMFTLQALITGSLWGKPTWGTYWVWDARLTSMLILFLMYLGLIALWQAVEDFGRAGRLAAILSLVGLVNVPIIKFSVDWWSTQHQPASILRTGGVAMDASFLRPLFIMALAYLAFFAALHLAGMRNEILRRRVAAAVRRRVDGGSPTVTYPQPRDPGVRV